MQAVLAAIADTIIQQQVQSDGLVRIDTREELKIAEKSMSQTAQSKGLPKEQFGIFKDAGFRGMYNRPAWPLIYFSPLLKYASPLDNGDTSNITSTLYPALSNGIGILSGGRGKVATARFGLLRSYRLFWAFVSRLQPAASMDAVTIVKYPINLKSGYENLLLNGIEQEDTPVVSCIFRNAALPAKESPRATLLAIR